jgi:transposase InsO family protein
MYSDQASTQNTPAEFLGTVQSNEVNNSSSWQRAINLNDSKVIFKIDTGADVSCISQRLYERRYRHIALKQQHNCLNGPDDTPLPVCGWFGATLAYKQVSIKEKIYVLQGKQALLSRNASVALGIVKLVGSISQPITPVSYKECYPKLFQGIGKLQGTYDIQLKDGAQPYSVGAPRRVPLPLMNKVKQELDRLESMKVIRRVEEPTDWCAPIVVVPKANQNNIRLCVDLTRLNKVVCRERHLLPSVDHTLGQLAGAKLFTKLDANSGFHQIELSKASALLTTFITPFGRYCYERLPFGINSGPEHFQKRIAQILEGLDGVVYLMDDIVVFGANEKQHNERVHAVLLRLERAGITLNSDKCEFAKHKIHFLGHIVGESGVSVDPDKVSSIRDMTPPTNITELRRFLGMTNQLMKFVPHLTDTTAPLRQLLAKDTEWRWDIQQDTSFKQVKDIITCSPVLALYDSNLDIKVSADSSSYGLGGVISQRETNGWRPIAYASRSLTTTESRYAQIEKEALASTWICEKFRDFLIGKSFLLETDHKPLVSLLGQKDIHELSPRIQRFRMRLMRYSYEVQHVPGKELYTADTLSRGPCGKSTSQDCELEEDTQAYVAMICQNLPATDQRLNEIRLHQTQDETCSILRKYVEEGWPDKNYVSGMIHQYWPHKDAITIQQDILMYEARIIIPSSLRLDILDRIHEGHQGISKCRERAKQSVWWPGLSRQIGDLVDQCRICCKNKSNVVEPLICSDIPDHPWHTIATDLFEYQQQKYLLLVDCYSRYIEIAKLDRTHSSDIINRMKSIFARHGIPVTVLSDNGPQYSAAEFTMFSKQYGFNHSTSSPGHASGNGAAERAVRTIKELLKGSGDPYLALLNYRTTPLANGYSPAELLMSRKLRTKLPSTTAQLQAKAPDRDRFNTYELSQRHKQKKNFDRAHVAKPLSPLSTGQEVWIPDRRQFGSVAKQHTERSYEVQTPTGIYRRNRVQLNKMPLQDVRSDHVTDPLTPSGEHSSPPTQTVESQIQETVSPSNTTRSGRVVTKPARYREEG